MPRLGNFITHNLNNMASKATQPRIAELADIISSSVSKLQNVLAANNAPAPSFDEDAPLELPKEASSLQDVIIDATAELHDVLLDPISQLYLSSGYSNMACLQAISRFKIASMVPANGQISYSDIADQTCMSEPALRRMLQYAMMLRVFREPEPGMVGHTKFSKFLMNDQNNDWMATGAEEGWPAVAKMVDALEKWPKSEEPNESGFAIANNTTDTMYDVMAANPGRAQRFANSMIVTTSNPRYSAIHAATHYDWASLGKATVVDVGGGQGHIAIELLKHFDNLSVIVQDLQSGVEGARVPPELEGRLTFQVHDFNEPQDAQADVYFFRWIFHNWSDKYGSKILKALVPALKPDSRIIIMDPCMQERGALPMWKEHIMRMGDITMGALLNARERTHDEWKALLASADSRFDLKELIQPPDSAMALLDIRWNATI
ncbi:sterigmatocystin 8-O-methyltransferase [Xylariaceae sp. FL1272]|nr:sterigmatocystin 8-O-methyltransferase [Xylariaceae sp. FL1272]